MQHPCASHTPQPIPSEMPTLSATYLPYSAPINSNLFSSDTSVQLGHPSFLNFTSNATTASPSQAPHKPYPPLELQSSPCACLHSPTASDWNNPLKHDGSWSAPPVPIAQSSLGPHALSPILPLSPLSAAAPTNEQHLAIDASQLPCWAPGPPTFSVPLQRRIYRPCTCPNCVNGVLRFYILLHTKALRDVTSPNHFANIVTGPRREGVTASCSESPDPFSF